MRKGGENGSLEKMVGVGGAFADGVHERTNLHVADGCIDRVFRTDRFTGGDEFREGPRPNALLL